jgi:hypothetical protein
MLIQRYDHGCVGPDGSSALYESEDGPLVLHPDHERAIKAKDAEIARLRRALERYRVSHRDFGDPKCIEYDGELGYSDDRCDHCKVADKALEEHNG